MKDYNYLAQSKAIYQRQKDKHLKELAERTASWQGQVVDPEKLQPEFRLLVADLAYFLSVHKKLLDQEERLLVLAPYEVRSKLQKQILQTYGDRMATGIRHYADGIEVVAQDLSAEEHALYKSYFQEHLLELYTLSCPFTKRAYEKPNGYAGDYQMMNMICTEDIYVGATFYEKCMQAFTVRSPSAAPVKNRVKLIFEELGKIVPERLKEKDRVRVLDLACGPSVPIRQFMANPQSDHLEVFFLDQDPEAITFLQDQMRNLKELHGRKTQFHFCNQPVQQVLTDAGLLAQLGNQDLIFSAGLFDYLQDDLAKMLVTVLYSLLAPGGTLLIGNLCDQSTGKVFQWYINDWPIYFRCEDQLRALTPEGAQGEVLAEELGFNLFLKVRKA